MKNPNVERNYFDIKTITDGDDVEDFSEDSDAEVEFQPSRQKVKAKSDFNTDFQFVSSTEEYNKDVWNDLAKYVKRKAKTKTEDKIKKARLDLQDNENETGEQREDIEGDVILSEDELKYDEIKVKESKKKKKNQEQADFFEEGETATDVVNFYEMNLSRPLMKSLTEMKFVHPTPIQASCIPVALLGRDVCGCAATGTGKTAAYMLPILERLLYRPVGTATTRVLVLVPTRELGVQIYQVSKRLSQYTDVEIALSVGGLDLKAQEAALRKHPDIVIATPGRLIDHLKGTASFSLSTIEVLVLDEADRMLDEYFAEQMKEIIRECAKTRQTMLFSATMTDAVNDLAAVSLNRPVKIFVDSNREVAFNLRQEFIRIRKDKEGDREALLAALVCRTFKHRCIIFVQTKKQAHRIHILLGLCGLKVVELHGNLTQPQRLQALDKFKDEEADIMVATDVAARGLDIEGVQTVINFMMPATLEHYIHRVGRTARAGRAGVSVSLAGENERKIVKDIVKRATKPVKSRIIPADIVEKYRAKLENMEQKIKEILEEEYAERLLSKTENQANRIENKLKGENEERPWFQTRKERLAEKDKLRLVPKEDKDNKRNSRDSKSKDKRPMKKSKKHELSTAEKRARDELQKVALVQARCAKRKSKMKRLKSYIDNTAARDRQEKKMKAKSARKKSNFANELTDVSQRGSKKLRHKAQVAKKAAKKGVTVNKKNQGKAFGRPQQKKQR